MKRIKWSEVASLFKVHNGMEYHGVASYVDPRELRDYLDGNPVAGEVKRDRMFLEESPSILWLRDDDGFRHRLDKTGRVYLHKTPDGVGYLCCIDDECTLLYCYQ